MRSELPDELPDDEVAELAACVDDLTAVRARIAAAQAAEARVLERAWTIAEREIERRGSRSSEQSEMAARAVASELGAAVRLSDRGMQRRMERAATLIRSYAATTAAWEAGEISQAHVEKIVRGGAALDDPASRSAYETAVLSRAGELTPARLEKYAGRVAERVHPRPPTERHRAARSERCVVVTDLADGMAELVAIIPAVLAHGIRDRLTQQARLVKDARALRPDAFGAVGAPEQDDGNAARAEPDTRGIDEIRADLLCDLLLTTTPTADSATGLGAVTAVVQVSVPATTLIGETGGGAELDGQTPIDAGTAQEIAGRARAWDRVFLDPATGCVTAVDRYRPSEAQRRLLRARDEHCRFLGCRTPAIRCDIDHTIAAAEGGATDENNLAHLCPRHHTMKHATAWRVRQLGAGSLEWTSPAGRSYVDRPPAMVRFHAAGDPPPF